MDKSPDLELEVTDGKSSNGNIYNPKNGHVAEPMLKEIEQDIEPKATDPMLSENGTKVPVAEQRVWAAESNCG